MKWKTRMTAEEAVLIALGIEDYGSLADAKSALSKLESELQNYINPADNSTLNESFITRKNEEINRLSDTLTEAHEIYKVLLDDIEFVAGDYDHGPLKENEFPPLVLTTTFIGCGGEGWAAPEKCTMTRQSLAEWFGRVDNDMARKIWPYIHDKTDETDETDETENTEKPIHAKTKNVYLNIIKVLSHALIGGSTNKHHTDAQAVLKYLELNGFDHTVVSSRKLADYLKEASE